MKQKRRTHRPKGKRVKRLQNRPSRDVQNDETDVKVPHSMVIHHGKVCPNMKKLISNFKEVMKPNTANKLKASKRNTLQDFVTMSGPLGVSHLIVFSQTDVGLYMRISRMPQGPTISFRVENYCLMKDVISNQKKQMSSNKTAVLAPCLMTNLQPAEGEKHLQLCSRMFLDMFPTISPTTVKPSSITRCCLIHYDKEESSFDFRHYFIKMRPVGHCKATRKLMSRNVPNLSSYRDVSDFVCKIENASESEAECESSQFVVTKGNKGTGEVKRQKSSVKLYELGPRLTLKLLKIEEGVWDGQVLYHSYIQKSNEEILRAEEEMVKRRTLKRKRQKEQERNVELKQKKKELHRQRCLEGMGFNASASSRDQELFPPAASSVEDDDAQYYREEVGEEPEEDLFKKRSSVSSLRNRKFSKKTVK